MKRLLHHWFIYTCFSVWDVPCIHSNEAIVLNLILNLAVFGKFEKLLLRILLKLQQKENVKSCRNPKAFHKQ